MKPLLVAPFLTERDLQVWGLVCERFRPRSACYWYEATQAADRRDAALMLQIEQCKGFPLKPAARYQIPVQLQIDQPAVALNEWNPLSRCWI